MRTGTVRAMHVDRVTIELDAASACTRCAEGRGCGIGAALSAGPAVRLDVPLPRGVEDGALRDADRTSLPGLPASAVLIGGSSAALRPGERVQVVMDPPDIDWLLAPALGYGLPCVGLLCGTLLGGAAGGLVGLAGGLVAWRACSTRLDGWLARRPGAPAARIVIGPPDLAKPAGAPGLPT